MAKRYHHLGMVAEEGRQGGMYLAAYDVWILSAFDTNPYGIEWLRYGPRAPVPEIVRRVPHVAFEVDDLRAELEGCDVIIPPNRPSGGVTVAFVCHDGTPVELLQFDAPASDPRSGGHSPLLPALLAAALPVGEFHSVDWSSQEPEEHAGDAGTSFWRTFSAGGARTRLVEYSPGFVADHGCAKGHILLVLEGELLVGLQDGREVRLGPGMGFVAGDDPANTHRAKSVSGARVFLVD